MRRGLAQGCSRPLTSVPALGRAARGWHAAPAVGEDVTARALAQEPAVRVHAAMCAVVPARRAFVDVDLTRLATAGGWALAFALRERGGITFLFFTFFHVLFLYFSGEI